MTGSNPLYDIFGENYKEANEENDKQNIVELPKKKVKSAQESTKHYCLESEDSIVPSGDSDSGSNDEVGDDINDSKDSQHGVELLELLPSFMEEENHDEIQTLSSDDLGSFNDGCETNSESVFPRIRSSHPKFDWEANNP
ncbi:hypothetical protein Sjap_015236 [Stephania japonica]|uniref:Uncharacterized protein n=1 Tax=Stephania japonica TaxID=461633 RepID=A0AAP0NSB3_9MAGN